MSEDTIKQPHYTWDKANNILIVRGSFLFVINGYEMKRLESGQYEVPKQVKTLELYSDWLKENPL